MGYLEIQEKIDKQNKKIEVLLKKIAEERNKLLSYLFAVKNTPHKYGTQEQKAFLADSRLPRLEKKICQSLGDKKQESESTK